MSFSLNLLPPPSKLSRTPHIPEARKAAVQLPRLPTNTHSAMSFCTGFLVQIPTAGSDCKAGQNQDTVSPQREDRTKRRLNLGGFRRQKAWASGRSLQPAS